MSRDPVALAFAEGILPPPRLTVSEWADQYRVLSSKGSSEPGRYRTERTPYVREIQDTMSLFNPTKKIVITKGAQMGVSEATMNFLGHTISLSPCPILVVYPIEGLAKRMSRRRFTPMVESQPILAEMFVKSGTENNEKTVLTMDFIGGNIRFGNAASPNSLSSDSIKVLVLDEVDRFPRDVKSEGDPVELAIKRTSAFTHHKIVMLSTPTMGGESRIEDEWEYSDQRF